MLDEAQVENCIFYNGIPFLMRLLPLSKKPKRWHNNLKFRIVNKIRNYRDDRRFLKELAGYDIIVISECLPNALWANYLAVEELRKKLPHSLIASYSDGPIASAPKHREMLLDDDDAKESRYDFNLFLSDFIETRPVKLTDRQIVIGLNMSELADVKGERDEFFAVLDFPREGYESYRQTQIAVLEEMGIRYVQLQGRYPIAEIRKIYAKASLFFMSFPETFGLPVAECLSLGCMVVTPSSAWPMAWRKGKHLSSWGDGDLPSCFLTYSSMEDLKTNLKQIRDSWHPVKTSGKITDCFIENYPHYFAGDKTALRNFLMRIPHQPVSANG